MLDPALLGLVLAATSAGTALGFVTGLVPGLHMNNIAAGVAAYGSTLFALLEAILSDGSHDDLGLMIASFISSALVAHIFSESVVTTYVGVPDEDVVSVLPAHRLARAGLGCYAVRSSSLGALAGVLCGVALLFPVCLLMGPPVSAYDRVSELMPIVVSGLIVMLMLSEAFPSFRLRHPVPAWPRKVLTASAVFLASGVLGTAVLMTNYYAVPIADLPWTAGGPIQKSSLLLPMFAGFFGVPSLLLGMSSPPLSGIHISSHDGSAPKPSNQMYAKALLGGIIVGWLPGMTAGSAATVCSPSASESPREGGAASAARFVWLYSAISACGAVMSLGALFVIGRARSGSMDAISSFVFHPVSGTWLGSVSAMSAILLSMVVASLLSHACLCRFLRPLSRSSRFLCSKEVAASSLCFVIGLSLLITGLRGAIVMAAAVSLGLLAPVIGVRRLQLMGSLLVPIWLLFVVL